ncbi:MAG: hypothetical protein AAGF79_10815 [Pseudomonadota bacterium]
MRLFLLSLALGFGISGPAKAGQPYHESLVECAVLIDLMLGEQSFVPDQNGMIDLYVAASNAMRAEAERRSSANYVTRTAQAKRAVWHERWDAQGWDQPENRQDLVAWWTYCFKLGRHLNLPL